MTSKKEGYALGTFHMDQQVVVEIPEQGILIRGVIQRVAYDSTYDHERYNIIETAPQEGRHWVSISWAHIHDKLAYGMKLKNEQLEQQLAQARALLEWLITRLESNEWLAITDDAIGDDKAIQRQSYQDREEAIAKIRAFLSGKEQQP